MIDFKRLCNKVIDNNNYNCRIAALSGSSAKGLFTATSDIDLLLFTEEHDFKVESITFESYDFEIIHIPVYILNRIQEAQFRKNRTVVADLIADSQFIRGDSDLYTAIVESVHFFRSEWSKKSETGELQFYLNTINRLRRDLVEDYPKENLVAILHDIGFYTSTLLLRDANNGNGSGKWKLNAIGLSPVHKALHTECFAILTDYYRGENIGSTVSQLADFNCKLETLIDNKHASSKKLVSSIVRNGLLQVHTNSTKVIERIYPLFETNTFYLFDFNDKSESILILGKQKTIESTLEKINSYIESNYSALFTPDVKISYSHKYLPRYLFGPPEIKIHIETVLSIISQEVILSSFDVELKDNLLFLTQAIIVFSFSSSQSEVQAFYSLYSVLYLDHENNLSDSQYLIEPKVLAELANLKDYVNSGTPTGEKCLDNLTSQLNQCLSIVSKMQIDLNTISDPLSIELAKAYFTQPLLSKALLFSNLIYLVSKTLREGTSTFSQQKMMIMAAYKK